MDSEPRKRGFAKLSPEERKRVAARGGAAVRPEQRSYSQSRTLAAEAGRLGGRQVPAEARSFSKDRKLAAAAGSKGGRASRRKIKNPDA